MNNSQYQSFLLDGKGSAKNLPSRDEALRLYQTLQSLHDADSDESQAVLWQHIHFENNDNREWLFHESGLDPLVIDELISPNSRPRCHAYDDGIFISLRGMNFHPQQKIDDMVSIRIWIQGNVIISAYRRPLASTADVIDQLAQGDGPTTAMDWVVTLIDRIVSRMQTSIDGFEGALTKIEDIVFSNDDDINASMKDISSIKRQIISLRRFLIPDLDAIKGLINHNDEISHLLDNSIDLLKRHIEHLDAINGRAGVLQDEESRLASLQLNKRMYALSIITAIFLPISFFAGLLGVNLSGIPGSESSASFFILVMILVFIVVLQIIYLKWKKWF